MPRYVKAEQLKPAPYNPRVPFEPGSPDWEALVESIKDHGLPNPIIWNQATGHIVGGHQRHTVAVHLGWKRYVIGREIVVINEPDIAKEKQLNVRLNKIGQHESIWDPAKLAVILKDLLEDDTDSNLALGFSPSEVAAVFADLDDGRDPDKDKPTRSRKGSPNASDTKYLQVFYNGEDYAAVIEMLKTLKTAWAEKAETPADIVFLALHEAAKRAAPKKG